MKKLLLALMVISLAGCTTAEDVLCNKDLDLTEGSFTIVSKQCLGKGDTATALVKIVDSESGEKRVYTLNLVNGNIVMNLDTSSALIHESAKNAEAMATFAAINSLNAIHSK